MRTTGARVRPSSGATDRVRAGLAGRVADAVRVTGPDVADGPAAAVAFLALDGCLLGWNAGVYPGQAWWWDRALTAVSRYADLPVPRPRLGSMSARWEQFPLRDELPLLDAVLTLVQHGGVTSLSLERVATVAGRDLDWLRSMYGTVDELLADVLDRVVSDGFDDLAPLHMQPSRDAVHSMLGVLADDRRTASLLRTLVLIGYQPAPGAVLAVQELSPVARVEPPALSDEEWVAALAVDGWTLSARAGGPSTIDRTVLRELSRLLRRLA